MNSPFYQPARQNFSSSQSMQQPQFGPSQGGFGGGQGFNFGGGQTFGGFQQPQFNPFQGGFGGGFGGFNPFQGGFGGGFSPMFGGIGGLGFNPMMGPQFGMRYGGGFGGGYSPFNEFGGFGGGYSPFNEFGGFGGFGGGYNPFFGGIGGLGQGFYPSQMLPPQPPQFWLQQPPSQMDMRYRGGPEMSPAMQQRREQDMRNMETMSRIPQQTVQQPVQQPGSAPQKSAIDPEVQYQNELQRMNQQRAMNPGGRSTQDWRAEYERMYSPNRMTMDMAPSFDTWLNRRLNIPVNLPGAPI